METGTVEMVEGRLVTVNGDKFKVGKNEYLPAVGELIQYTVRDSEWGKYLTVLGKNARVSDERKQVLIVRQNSVTNAVHLAVAKNNPSVEEVKKIASQLEEWVNRQ